MWFIEDSAHGRCKQRTKDFDPYSRELAAMVSDAKREGQWIVRCDIESAVPLGGQRRYGAITGTPLQALAGVALTLAPPPKIQPQLPP